LKQLDGRPEAQISFKVTNASQIRTRLKGKTMISRKAIGACFASLLVATTAFAARPSSGLQVVLREYSRTFVLAPGESAGIASACRRGETVLGGSPTSIPLNVSIVYSSLFFDGVGSGWTVEYRNDGAQDVTVQGTTGALCTVGRLIPG
jgi:hypothetical protein